MKYPRRGILLLSTMTLLMLMSCRLTPGPEPGQDVVPAKPVAPVEMSGTDTQAGLSRGAITEPVTMLWSNPGQLRDYDHFLLEKPSNPAVWAAGMDTEMRLWLVGKAETQALYGEPVVILERCGEWLRVAAAKQKSSLNELGYPGWVPAVHVITEQSYLSDLETRPNIVVAKPLTKLYANQELTEVVTELCYQTRLPLLEEKTYNVAVRLPDGGTGYLPRQDVKKTSELTFSAGDIVNEAMSFLGLRYIWAGTSSYGFDCSGYTMRLYQSQGISIPRDAHEQAREGQMVDKSDLLPGDLLFFAAKEGQGQIHHVAMYIGNGMMIHSPNSSSSVQIDAIDSGAYIREYWGAKRYIP
ncbi:C40 family peptidase [Pelotomaculum isophthalicicum JI]|uniref:C40 family peptidase n=1 Tax=Pelotomaculum isophthalicicum JI TaxID=947010 RepID=A0A9X4JWI8_9FIRM|nr:C40 family peptidase [Pelotomaculum isophthalicicum]MDF9409193.1 C40 family peptidase [Pelotomaculum isophthalicicum JI]